MKQAKCLLGVALLILAVGCVSQSRATFNTLASVQTVTTGAYNTYLDLVIQHKIPTNSVPQVSKDYNFFQTVWTATVIVAQWNTNNPPTQVVMDAAQKVVNSINTAKGQ